MVAFSIQPNPNIHIHLVSGFRPIVSFMNLLFSFYTAHDNLNLNFLNYEKLSNHYRRISFL